MIPIKSPADIRKMTKAGEITYLALMAAKDAIRPGISTWEIDKIAESVIRSHGAAPSFLGYNGFPATLCISIDSEVVHGIPSKDRTLEEGQIVSIDCGAYIGGFHGDSALSVCVGEAAEAARLLVERTERCFWEGYSAARAGSKVGDIGCAIQKYAESFGYGVIRALCGHGIGRQMHEEPQVPNYGKAGTGAVLKPGMTICIEPMISAGHHLVDIGGDGWIVTTRDGSLASHYEHTLLITDGDPVILTVPESLRKDFLSERRIS